MPGVRAAEKQIMSQHFHIVFRKNATGEEVAQDFGPFPPDDWDLIEAFGRYTKEVEQTSIASQWRRYSPAFRDFIRIRKNEYSCKADGQ